MEKYITDERTGLRYELVGDYYLISEISCTITGINYRTFYLF